MQCNGGASHGERVKTDLKILVVEDVAADFELMRRELDRGGLSFTSRRVETNEELQAELIQQPPDLVLSDHGCAKSDSFAVLDIVRRRLPDLPFIVVTGSLGEEQVAKVFARGADDCVFKHRLFELVPAVQRALHLSEERRRLRGAERERDQLQMELQALRAERLSTRTIVPICMECKSIRDKNIGWVPLESHFWNHFNIRFSHGLCPVCAKKYTQ